MVLLINRKWAMPNKWTFTIKPIKVLLKKYVGDGKGWVDPFAGNYSPAEFTNDIDPKTKAKEHLLAKDWVKKIQGPFKGVLWDPPYSGRQVSEHYKSLGLITKMNDTNSYFYSSVRKQLIYKIIINGLVICCGWNSHGFGKNNGFEMIEILLVCHGGHHNDTIVTVERKINNSISDF